MPIYFQRKTEDKAIIGIWQITESSDELLEKVKLNDSEKKRCSTFKLEKRKQEWLAVRALLQHYQVDKCSIDYQQNGQPILINSNWHIGISHTKGYATIILHPNKKVAIDIERPSPRILKVSDRFFRDNERILGQPYTDELFQTIVWSAKEAMYKWWGETEVEFKEQLIIDSLNEINSNEIGMKTTLIKESDKSILPLRCCITDEYVLVYTC